MALFETHKNLGIMDTLALKAKRAVAPSNAYEDKDMELWKRYKAGDSQAKWALLERFNY